MKVTATLPELEKKFPSPTDLPETPKLHHRSAGVETIGLAYHGYVFDASGYGQAARGYLHALHRAGVNLTVVDLAGNRARQVDDPLVASLVGQPIDPDFNLFHGTPPLWARLALPLRNVIAMTVWETDTMPAQWQPVLTHATDVWLPCDFNAAVFSAALGKPVFKLPHPVVLRGGEWRRNAQSDRTVGNPSRRLCVLHHLRMARPQISRTHHGSLLPSISRRRRNDPGPEDESCGRRYR